jgi:hypothetical protein
VIAAATPVGVVPQAGQFPPGNVYPITPHGPVSAGESMQTPNSSEGMSQINGSTLRLFDPPDESLHVELNGPNSLSQKMLQVKTGAAVA